MFKDEVLNAVEVRVHTEMSKVKYHSFKLIKDSYSEYINFPNGEYLFDRYNEFIATLSDETFGKQTKRRYVDIEGGIDEKDISKYIGSNVRISPIDADTLTITYDDVETFDEVVIRIYIDVMYYAQDCYRKEYLSVHGEVKLYDIKDFYGKWIEDYKPIQFKGIEQGDFISIKVEYTDNEGGFDIKVGWYDKYINDNGYNIFVSNVDSDYKIVAWSPLPKVS